MIVPAERILNEHIDFADIASLINALQIRDTNEIKKHSWVLAAVDNGDSYKQLEIIGYSNFEKCYYSKIFNNFIVVFENKGNLVLFYFDNKHSAIDTISIIAEESEDLDFVDIKL